MNGQTQWNDNGTLICNRKDPTDVNQWTPQLCSDLNGGAIIAWRDDRDDSSGDIYAQRIGTPILKSAPSGGDDDDDDDKVKRPTVAGYDVYIILGAIGLMAAIFVKKLKKPIKRL